MDDREYSLIEHLAELRVRLVRAALGVLLVAFAAFVVSDEILELLRRPMEQILREARGPSAHFIVTGAADYIMCQMKAALVAATFLASPWILYQVWMFIAPGLYDHEKRYVTAFVWAGAACFCGGAAFAYFAVFPAMFGYLVESLPPDIAMMPSLDEHFSFTLKMLLGFGIVFETPVVIVILSVAGIIDPSTLGQYRRYVIVAAFIIGAVLTPTPDYLSQTLLAGPLIVLFELGVLVSRVVVRISGTPLSRKQRAEADAASKAAS